MMSMLQTWSEIFSNFGLACVWLKAALTPKIRRREESRQGCAAIVWRGESNIINITGHQHNSRVLSCCVGDQQPRCDIDCGDQKVQTLLQVMAGCGNDHRNYNSSSVKKLFRDVFECYMINKCVLNCVLIFFKNNSYYVKTCQISFDIFKFCIF